MSKPDLKDLGTINEIDLTVRGRKSGKDLSRPVWFVQEDDKLYLLPVQGSDTNWYRNVLKNPSVKISVEGENQVKIYRDLFGLFRKMTNYIYFPFKVRIQIGTEMY